MAAALGVMSCSLFVEYDESKIPTTNDAALDSGLASDTLASETTPTGDSNTPIDSGDDTLTATDTGTTVTDTSTDSGPIVTDTAVAPDAPAEVGLMDTAAAD